jgi:hypothetical protein
MQKNAEILRVPFCNFWWKIWSHITFLVPLPKSSSSQMILFTIRIFILYFFHSVFKFILVFVFIFLRQCLALEHKRASNLLCSSVWPQTQDPLSSVLWVVGLQACTTMHNLSMIFWRIIMFCHLSETCFLSLMHIPQFFFSSFMTMAFGIFQFWGWYK